MSGAWSEVPEGMMRVAVTADLILLDGVTHALNVADIPRAVFGGDGDGVPIVEQGGYLLNGNGRAVSVVILGRSSLSQVARQAQRDGMIQQARAALAAAYTVRVDEYGHLVVTQPRLLSCGLCYEEDGEEVHPHPECAQ